MKEKCMAELAALADKTDWEGRTERLKAARLAVKNFPDVFEFRAEYGEALAGWHLYAEAASEMEIAFAQSDGNELLLKRKLYFAELGDVSKRITVSACAIMKDEMSNVKLWLENVRAFADEIIVVDTGSQDGTREFLQEQADVRVIEYQWHNDFSAAKNQAVNAVGCDWFVFTDADEYFYSPSSIKGWLALLQKQYSNCDAAFVPMRNVDTDRDDSLITAGEVVRIFRNYRGIRYQGAVHEQPNKLMGAIEYLRADEALTLRHTGYSSSIIRRKHERNFLFLEKEVKHGKDPELYYGFMSECCFGLQKYNEAVKYAILAYKSSYRAVVGIDSFYRYGLLSIKRLGLSVTDRLPEEAAEEFCLKVLQEDKWNVFALLQWLDLQITKPTDEVLQRLEPIYFSASEDVRKLLDILEENGFFELVCVIYKEQNISTNDMAPLYQIYKMLAKGTGRELDKEICSHTLRYTNFLVVSMLVLSGISEAQSDWCEHQMKFLPDSYQRIVALFHDRGYLAELDFTVYVFLLDYVVIYADENVLKRYLELAAALPGKNLIRLGDRLVELGKHKAALGIYGRVQAGDAAITGEFWLNCGKCFYAQQDYQNARAIFGEAGKILENSDELMAYMAWCREAGAE